MDVNASSRAAGAGDNSTGRLVGRCCGNAAESRLLSDPLVGVMPEVTDEKADRGDAMRGLGCVSTGDASIPMEARTERLLDCDTGPMFMLFFRTCRVTDNGA